MNSDIINLVADDKNKQSEWLLDLMWQDSFFKNDES